MATKYDLALIVGHGTDSEGNWDCGCAYKYNGKTYTEADLMYKIVKEAVVYLRRSGLKIWTDADIDNKMNMLATVRKANELKIGTYISVHCDYSKAPSGTLPIYCKGSSKGKKLAQTLNKVVMKEMKLKGRGYLANDDYEVNATDGVACIFETGSINADLSKLKDYKAYGKALAKAICEYFNIPLITTTKKLFTIKTKRNLIVRKTSSLMSAKLDVIKENTTWNILATDKNGTRGLTKKGWITITDKYVEKL